MADCLQTHHQQLVPSLWHMPPLRTSGVCFPSFHSADFVTCFQQQDAVETTLSHFGGHWPLQGWQLLLLSFRNVGAMCLRLDFRMKRGHTNRESPSQDPAVPSTQVKHETHEWSHPGYLSSQLSEWHQPKPHRAELREWAWPVHGSMRNNKSVSAKSWDDFSRQRRIIKIFLNFYYVFYILHVIYGLLKD